MEHDMMNEKEYQKTEEIEIDVGQVFRAVVDRAWVVAVTAVICAAVTFVGTWFLITPRYESAAMFYVNNTNLSLGDASFGISSGDLSTSRNLVDSYIVILNTRETLVDVIEYAGASCTYTELREMISAAAVDGTEIFKVTVTGTDPNEVERLANAIAYILPMRIDTIIDGTSAKVVETADVPSGPSSPSYTVNTAVGFLLGVVMAVGVIALREILDSTIRTEEDVKRVCSYPILAAVPDMNACSCAGYGAGSRRREKNAVPVQSTQAVIGPDIGFAAAEAYKLLRTKVRFSFADENDCHVIGLSSALCGEGKSVTAANLAYTLSQLDKKVLLVDCDMRRSTLAKKVGLGKQFGLSNYLTGQNRLDEVIQICAMKDGEKNFYVIAGGQNPPNPVELLSSARMKKALAAMRQVYDYVILNLPPVGEVADALTVAQETDGMLLVVRQNECNRKVLADAICQFDFIRAKILGVVLNCTCKQGGNYGQGAYRRYDRHCYKHR